MKQQILYALQIPESPQEEATSKILTEGNLSFIRNQLAMEAQRRLNMNPPTGADGYQAFIQEEAEIKGAMRAFSFLLDCHHEVIAAVNQENLPTL